MVSDGYIATNRALITALRIYFICKVTIMLTTNNIYIVGWLSWQSSVGLAQLAELSLELPLASLVQGTAGFLPKCFFPLFALFLSLARAFGAGKHKDRFAEICLSRLPDTLRGGICTVRPLPS